MSVEQRVILEKFNRSLKICEIHIERMNHAISGLTNVFPLSVDSFPKISPDDIQAIDQFLYRFIKLQDELGNKTFRLLLLNLQEDIEGKPFLEILSKLEQLRVIENEDVWITLREIRNEIAHEYPEMVMDNILGLNNLFKHVPDIIIIYNQVVALAKKYKLLID